MASELQDVKAPGEIKRGGARDLTNIPHHQRKFPEATELKAEKAITYLLNTKDRKLRLDAAKFVVEQNRGRAPQSLSMDLRAGITIQINDFTQDAVNKQLPKSKKEKVLSTPDEAVILAETIVKREQTRKDGLLNPNRKPINKKKTPAPAPGTPKSRRDSNPEPSDTIPATPTEGGGGEEEGENGGKLLREKELGGGESARNREEGDVE